MELMNSHRIGSRRPFAVGVWSLLIAGLAIVPREIPFEISLLIVATASISSTVAALTARESGSRSSQKSWWHRQIPMMISTVISLSWAMLLGYRGTAFAASL